MDSIRFPILTDGFGRTSWVRVGWLRWGENIGRITTASETSNPDPAYQKVLLHEKNIPKCLW